VRQDERVETIRVGQWTLRCFPGHTSIAASLFPRSINAAAWLEGVLRRRVQPVQASARAILGPATGDDVLDADLVLATGLQIRLACVDCIPPPT
jgi:hypothetical protein